MPQYDLSAWETLRRLEGKYFGRNLQTVTVVSKYYCTLPPGNTNEKKKEKKNTNTSPQIEMKSKKQTNIKVQTGENIVWDKFTNRDPCLKINQLPVHCVT